MSICRRRLEDLGREDQDTEPIPNEGARQGEAHQSHDFPSELVVGKRRQMNQLIELRLELPGRGRHSASDGEHREEQRLRALRRR